MNIRLRSRLILTTLMGALVVISVGAALQLREVAVLVDGILGADARLLAAGAEMQRLLGEPDRGPGFTAAFEQQLREIEAVPRDPDHPKVVAEVRAAFEAYIAGGAVDDLPVRNAVAAVTTRAAQSAAQTVELAHTEANTAALGLGIVAALALIAGAWISRAARTALYDRLIAVQRAAEAISEGESNRRVALHGDDELAKVARALDHALDDRDRAEAEMRGRNRELRALLVALLRRWSRPAAVTGIDGEILVSTLSEDQEDVLRSLASQVRAAARTLISRKFVTAGDLATDIRVQTGHVVYIRALALGDQRIVGWLAVFGRGDAIESGEGRDADQLIEG